MAYDVNRTAACVVAVTAILKDEDIDVALGSLEAVKAVLAQKSVAEMRAQYLNTVLLNAMTPQGSSN